MKKAISLIVTLSLLFTLSSCQLIHKFKEETPAETSTAASEETTVDAVKGETLKNTTGDASAAYEAYLATIDPIFPITHALVTDLDNNDIPEVIVAQGETGHMATILSYGKTNGLSKYYPVTHSSTRAEIYFSEEEPYLYYTDNGHNHGTAWIHEGVCFKSGEEGFENIANISGDFWDAVPDEIWQDNKLFDEYDKKYDDIFELAVSEAVGNSEFKNFYDFCEKENTESYLNNELSINISGKRKEYEEFRSSAAELIKDSAGEEAEILFVDDFDRNGTYEAFAYVGQDVKDEFNYSVKSGKLWFVNCNKEVSLLKEGNFNMEIYCIDGTYNKYFYAEDQIAKNLNPHLWYVDGDKCSSVTSFDNVAIENFDLSPINVFSNSITAISVDYDRILSNLNELLSGGGKSKKTYFFYDTPNGIKEYSATEITTQQFEEMGGGKYIDSIESEGYTVRNILYSENGLIHVNFYVEDENGYNVFYITYKKTVNSVYPLDYDFNPLDTDTKINDMHNTGIYLPLYTESAAY